MHNLFGVLALVTLAAAVVFHVLLVRALVSRVGKSRLVADAVFPPLALLDGHATGAKREALFAALAIAAHAIAILVARLTGI
ncbi:hypothetical protein BH09MYX1_BH09MYX1_55800 [soil metagenome]